MTPTLESSKRVKLDADFISKYEELGRLNIQQLVNDKMLNLSLSKDAAQRPNRIIKDWFSKEVFYH